MLLELAVDTARTPASCSARRSPAPGRSRTSSASSPTARTSSASPTGPSSSSPSRPARTARASCPSCSTSTPPSCRELPDLQIVRLVKDERATHEVAEGEIEVSGTLGGQMMVWEYATAVAGRLLGINPFDQPDVESAKIARAALLDARPNRRSPPSSPTASRCAGADRRRRQRPPRGGASAPCSPRSAATVPRRAGVPRSRRPPRGRRAARRSLAARAHRPVTFGWGPRSWTPPGSSIRAARRSACSSRSWGSGAEDLQIPDRPFTSGSCSRPRQRATPASSPTTAAPCSRSPCTDPATEPARPCSTRSR